jgi:cardiolipin synthase
MSYPAWLLALAALGLLALGSTVLALFSSLGRRPNDSKPTEICSVDSGEFLETLAGVVNAPLQHGGTATLLNNGDAFFPEMLQAIREARQTINFFVYIWKPGRASDVMMEALIERARAGVEVRLLLDGLGGIRAPRRDLARLRAAGGHVRRFRAARPGKLLRFYKHNHRRAIVIDARIGFTGGAAIGDCWLGNAQDARHWRFHDQGDRCHGDKSAVSVCRTVGVHLR